MTKLTKRAVCWKTCLPAICGNAEHLIPAMAQIAPMKFVSTLLAALISSAAAAPAIVWSGSEGSVQHYSDVIDAKTVISSVTPEASTTTSVVFVVGRDEHGSEGLTGLTSSGALPNVASKYVDATSVHHYVRGIESVEVLAKDVKASNANVIEASLHEFQNRKVNAAANSAVSSEGVVSSATELYVVNVPADAAPAEIDMAITSAIEDGKVGSVVLTAVRGVSEVKLERDVNARKMYREMQQKTSRRRLEDGNGGNDNSNQGVYFVNFTPNIFSGLLFFLFFTVTTYIGVGCMNNIAGQDVYVTKYPTIGREA